MEVVKGIKCGLVGTSGGRVEWCDVYKGIIILLVVIGHCTGRFNQWIYQFHMAAFFFVSGFTSKKENKVFDYAIKRFCRLMIPYYGIGFIGICLFGLADQVNVLSKISTTIYPDKFIDAVLGLFNNTVLYCDYLGPTWFLPVLFISSIILQILIHLFEKDRFISAASVLLFLYFIHSEAFGGFFVVKLAGIAQFFLTCGYLLKKRGGRWEMNVGHSMIIMAAAAVLWFISRCLGFKDIVDWPSNTFNGWSDMLLPIPGILFSVGVSLLLTKCLPLKLFFSYLGMNSMGIMFFHLVGFKIAYLMLILTGNMKLEDFCLLTPGFTGMDWKSILVILTSVLFSILCWTSLNKTKLAFLTGKGAHIESFILNMELFQDLKGAFGMFSEAVRQSMVDLKYECKILRHKWILCSLLFVSILLVSGIRLYSYRKPINVKFPYFENLVEFGNGWLPQNTGEAYRWVGRESVFKTFITEQDTLSITGYIPEEMDNVTYYRIKLNGKEIYYSAAHGNTSIDVKEVDISNHVNPYFINKFEIELDGERTVSPSDLDQRVFSALIDSIVIE